MEIVLYWYDKTIYKIESININVTVKRKTSASKKIALACHQFREAHDYDFTKIHILDHDNKCYKRCISVMIHIFLNNTFNTRTDTAELNDVYTYILNLFKKCITRTKQLKIKDSSRTTVSIQYFFLPFFVVVFFPLDALL